MTSRHPLSRILPLATGVALATMPAQANPLSFTNDSGGTVTFYGQFSPSWLHFDDGDETYDNLVDNTHSNTRLGFTFEQDLANGQNLLFRFETGLAIPGSGGFSQRDDDPDWVWEKTDLRFIDLAWSGGFGTFSIGQGSMATDGVTGNDFSGTTLVSTVTTADTAGSYFFREDDGGGLSDIALKSAFATFDGDRKGRIRYDTPSWNGFSLAVGYGTDVLKDYWDNTYYDIAATYRGEFSDVKLAGGIGYAWVDYDDSDDTGESWAGSVSALHGATGLNGSLAVGAQKDGGHYTYGKIGWITGIWNFGATAFSADYYYGEDFGHDGSESKQWGLQAAQSFDDWNLEAFVGYANYSFDGDDGSPDYQDASSVMTGLRWKF